jgi:ubiquinone/menaquinone biosynthesis C-methylase UbiE
MERRPEPELMLSPDQAAAYAAADFSEPHNHFVELCCQHNPQPDLAGPVLDLGCGPGDVTFRFARAFPLARITAVDGSEAMLAQGRQALEREPTWRSRIQFLRAVLPADPIPQEPYVAIFSNSLLHHLHEPLILWQTVKRCARSGTRVWIMDLRRPVNESQARALTDVYAAGAPEVLERDFHNSLLAAFEPPEVEAQLRQAGLAELQVKVVSDRHLFVHSVIL